MECKNKRYVVDPFIAFEAVNYPAETRIVGRNTFCKYRNLIKQKKNIL